MAQIGFKVGSLDRRIWGCGYKSALPAIGLSNSSNLSYPEPAGDTFVDTTWTQLSATISSFGEVALVGIKTNGTLWTCGFGLNGELGDGTAVSKSSPTQLLGMAGTTWTQVHAGWYACGAVRSDGTLWMWGNNNVAKLGNGLTTYLSSPAQTVAFGNTWKQVSSSYEHSAAVKTDGTLWTWGQNSSSELGRPGFNTSSPGQTLTLGNNWSLVSVGRQFSTAIKTDGTLWTWGDNGDGQLGNSSTVSRSSPGQTVAAGNTWKTITCGYFHWLAIKTDGTLWTCGYDSYGQLGIGVSFSNRSSPVQTVAIGSNWLECGAGRHHSAALKIDGTLWTWGKNDNTHTGAIGDGTTIWRSSPGQTLATENTWYSVTCGYGLTIGQRNAQTITASDLGDMLVARDIWSEGSLWLVGQGSRGELGNNSVTTRSSPVQTISGGTNWEHVSCGYYMSAGVKSDGTLWLWGNSTNAGPLGNSDATFTHRSSPVQTVATGTNWLSVECNKSQAAFVAAVKSDGTLWTWGQNSNGQLGNSSTVSRSSPGQTITASNDWSHVSCGYFHTAAVKTNGTLWLWGSNANGQLGLVNPTASTSVSSPAQTMTLGNNWKQVCCGTQHTVAVKTDGTLWSWGDNSSGQLGRTVGNTSSPGQTLTFGNNWHQCDANRNSSAAVKTDGTLWLWGRNDGGQLGNNATSGSAVSSPVQTISTTTNWKYVSCGYALTSAIKTDGTLWTWGSNQFTQLGDGTNLNKSSPVQTLMGGNNWKLTDSSRYFQMFLKDDSP